MFGKLGLFHFLAGGIVASAVGKEDIELAVAEEFAGSRLFRNILYGRFWVKTLYIIEITPTGSALVCFYRFIRHIEYASGLAHPTE